MHDGVEYLRPPSLQNIHCVVLLAGDLSDVEDAEKVSDSNIT
jgi:hypothetical protein